MTLRVDHAELSALLADACDRHRVPGAVLGVDVGGEQLVVAHGVRNTATGDPMTTDTVAQVASVSKVFTATALHLVLAEHGVRLDTPIADVVPELATLDTAITIRRLLDHTSGLESDLWDDTGANDDAIARYTSIVATVGSITPPGEMLSYCNTGYVSLGRALEVLTGRSFERVIRQRVVDPLGLRHTALRLSDAVQHRLALGHELDAGGGLRPSRWIDSRALRPTGGVLSSVPDVLALARALTTGSSDAVPAWVFDTMSVRSSTAVDPWTAGPGWGLGLTDCTGADGTPVVGHDGLGIGAGAYVRMVPSLDLAIAMTGAAGHARTVWQEVSRELLGRVGLTPPTLVPRPPSTIDVERYVGTYRRLGQTAIVSVDHEGGLQLTTVPTGVLATKIMPPPVPLTAAGPDVFTARASTGVDLPVVFVGGDGPADYLHTGMRAARRVDAG